MPTFSIIIPTYNRVTVIAHSLNSILAQTFQDWECLVVDDSSTDNTREIVQKYCNSDSRFRYILNKEKKGANGARNTGIKQAKGRYVSFLDSDDSWHSDMLEQQLSKYTSDIDISCVYSKLQTVYSDGSFYPWEIFHGLEGHIYAKVLEQGYMTPTITLSAKRKCFEEVGLFDLEFPASQDDDMCFRLAKNYKVGYIPLILADVTISATNRISDNKEKVSLGWWRLWNKYESDVLEYCGKEVMAKHYNECFHDFVQANNAQMTWKAYCKFTQFGGRLSKKRQVALFLYCLSMGKNRRITHKIQKII